LPTALSLRAAPQSGAAQSVDKTALSIGHYVGSFQTHAAHVRNFLIRKLPDGTADSVFQALENLLVEYGDRFSRVFKTITGDNGSEFSHLSELEHSTATKVYFTHPYSSFEKGTNERHNGLIRRFIPKGHSIDNYSEEQIAWIEDWCNTLPRKILGYATPEELFEAQLDELYVAA